MQISAQSVLAAQQQTARAQKPASQPAPFEPPDLKAAEKPSAAQAAETPAPAGYVRPGTNIDIKV